MPGRVPLARRVWWVMSDMTYSDDEKPSLVLDDADPAGRLTIARTKPNVVTARKPDLDRKVWS